MKSAQFKLLNMGFKTLKNYLSIIFLLLKIQYLIIVNLVLEILFISNWTENCLFSSTLWCIIKNQHVAVPLHESKKKWIQWEKNNTLLTCLSSYVSSNVCDERMYMNWRLLLCTLDLSIFCCCCNFQTRCLAKAYYVKYIWTNYLT